eukprot:TRINITY_DN2673_c0_g1_i3.p1 TRINITY_DN2673_c0_g1~~TRINITY_DN2673_c0_g1_i3.p1  ORF type:complete len:136 (+),score=21.55 TRINITY_DN2673_c0_g1_i3:52-459(+)
MKNQIMCAFIILLLEYVFGQYPSDLSELEKSIMQEIDSLNVLIYVDSSDRDCNEIVSILKSYNIIEMKVVAVDIAENEQEMRKSLRRLTDQASLPYLFIEHMNILGKPQKIKELHENGYLRRLLDEAGALNKPDL